MSKAIGNYAIRAEIFLLDPRTWDKALKIYRIARLIARQPDVW
jgi:hypothetical protein